MPGVVADTINRKPAITASAGFPIATHACVRFRRRGRTGLRCATTWAPPVRDEALEVRKLRDRKVGRPPQRIAPKPCAPHEPAARRGAALWKARCNAGDRRSPPTRRRRVENPLALSGKPDRMSSGDTVKP